MDSIPAPAAERDGATWFASERVDCWQCGAEHAPGPFCPACKAIQPLPEQADYFQVLGVSRRLALDATALQQRYYDLHRRLHPDLFQTGPQPARQASVRNTAAVNRAYRTLRDPVDRGLYWLTLRGESLGAGNKQVPSDMAALVFELHDQLEELRAARQGNGAGRLVEELTAAHSELLERHSALLEQLERNFARWDAGTVAPDLLTRELKAILSTLAYLGTLIRDVEKGLET
ncbi:MAG: Fe-S protein assembly co-chaperone HscB [Candidatus Binatia bacterium]